jgi:hypothetical protein
VEELIRSSRTLVVTTIPSFLSSTAPVAVHHEGMKLTKAPLFARFLVASYSSLVFGLWSLQAELGSARPTSKE